MSCWIRYKTDRHRDVNVGWLIKHWKKIDAIHPFRVENEPSRPNTGNVRLTVSLRWGCRSDQYGETVEFVAIYASGTVLKTILDRPVFRDLWVNWVGKSYKIGSKEYRETLQP